MAGISPTEQNRKQATLGCGTDVKDMYGMITRGQQRSCCSDSLVQSTIVQTTGEQERGAQKDRELAWF